MQCLQRAVEPDLKLMRAKREAEDGPYVPFYRSEAYPTNFCHVNFRQLPLKTLMLYAVLFGINVRPDCSRDECATAVARHFATWQPDEAAVLQSLRADLRGDSVAHAPRHRRSSSPDSDADGSSGGSGDGGVAAISDAAAAAELRAVKRHRRSPSDAGTAADGGSGSGGSGGDAAAVGVGSMVAALVGGGGGDAFVSEGWILARVVRALDGGRVEVKDEDDVTRRYALPRAQVIRLSADAALRFNRGEPCLAVFPDTTSFYRGTVHRAPRAGDSTVAVCFEEDVDEAGKPIVRRVRAVHVVPAPRLRTPARARPPPPSPKAPPAAPLTPTAGGKGGGGGSGSGAASSVFPPGMDTYSNRIAYALHKLPDQRGSFTEICDIIEQDFSDSLNWKLESDVRRTPVWKSSVRKILISNQRFKTIGPESKHDFTFSSPAAARMC